jgi:hypothetical protein
MIHTPGHAEDPVTVRSVVSSKRLKIDAADGDMGVSIVGEKGLESFINVDVAEFLSAVAAELDAIVISRADLPRIVAVSQDGLDFTVDFGEGRTVTFSDETPESIDETALGWLAIRDHFREHQPLNIVSFLAGEIAAARGESAGTSDFQAAWRLVRSGRIEVKAEGGDAS